MRFLKSGSYRTETRKSATRSRKEVNKKNTNQMVQDLNNYFIDLSYCMETITNHNALHIS